jgi:hypothetical protein
MHRNPNLSAAARAYVGATDTVRQQRIGGVKPATLNGPRYRPRAGWTS